MSVINQHEMLTLMRGLDERNIPFTVCSLYDGIQVKCKDWDAICHNWSYGGKSGLLEVMGLPQCDGDVIGYLTAEQVLQMVDE